MRLILCVLFVMTLFLWLLALLGGFSMPGNSAAWLPWFSVLFLGLAVFVDGPPSRP